ncbi:ABC transporter ATP-binding protein [Marivita sp. S6314]|uniref:ABC transporter ATP-binding protein n=1 Tax=Marivita sp. S6314 TaxID=2926406 RepID=UPI001FF33D32|nr:ABC transporter ATP-binding protein [Marivita sp. S6314]MCK0150848.1 ABC transporter ATP-binding protein [Marivita sp. S6314]
MTKVLDVSGLKTHFFTRAGVVKAVDGVDFSVSKGEIMGLVGESGSGKSITGFSVLGLIDPPGRIVDGSIKFNGQELANAGEEQFQRLRGNRISMIFQDPMMTLNPVLRVDTQMIEAILAHENVTRQAAWERSRDALGLVGIPSPEERLRAYPHQLSGGMRQRVAIATAFLNQPDLIIADEPTTALDVTIQAQIIYEAQQLTKRTGTAMVWITHDLAVVAGLVDRISVMYAGRIVEQGGIDDVIDRPRHPYTVGLLGSVPTANRRGKRLFQIEGMTPNVLDMPKGCAFGPRCHARTEACREEPAIEDVDGRRLRCFNPQRQAEVVS